MSDFLRFFREHLAHKALLVWALVFAFAAASGLGAGLLVMIAIFKLIVDQENEGRGLVAWAESFNGGDHMLTIPVWVIDQLPTDRFEGVVLTFVVLGILTVLGATCNFLHQYFSLTLAAKTIARVRQTAYDRVLHMPLGVVTLNGPSQFIARIIRDSAELQRGIIALTGKAVANVTKGAAAFAFALFTGGKLTLAALLIVPIVMIVLRKLGKRIRRGMRGALQGQEELLRIATESVQGLRAVKANTGETAALAEFARHNENVVRQELRARTAKALSSPLLESIAIFAFGGLAMYAAKEIIDERITFDSFIVAMVALGIAGSSLKPLAGIVNELQAASAPARRLAEILSHPHEEPDEMTKPDLPRHRKSISFEEISLTYPNAPVPALDNVSLSVKHGQRVAIVGPNGSGKTTLLSLLPRLLTPCAGRVLIDGQDISQYNLKSLRTQIGVVTQETVLFRGTIEENIAYGMTNPSHELIVDAAKHARAHGFITSLPDAYESKVLELGASLSGGQRQRLAIARALLRDPTILILDEATSQIDAESEAQISEAIIDISENRTVILIAHRLATVIDADDIVVMDDGKIVDRGRHDELLERCELYRRLTHTQLQTSA